MSEAIIEHTLRHLAFTRLRFRHHWGKTPTRDDESRRAEATYLGMCYLAKAQHVISEDAFIEFTNAIYDDTLSPLLLDLYEQYAINPDEPHMP